MLSKEEIEKAIIWVKERLEYIIQKCDLKDEDYKRAFDNLKVINMSLQENKSLKHTNKSYKGIINKQNKVIDEMANYIANWDVEEDICKKVEKPLCNNETSVPVSYCVECVKQYFEKKVEEDIC